MTKALLAKAKLVEEQLTRDLAAANARERGLKDTRDELTWNVSVLSNTVSVLSNTCDNLRSQLKAEREKAKMLRHPSPQPRNHLEAKILAQRGEIARLKLRINALTSQAAKFDEPENVRFEYSSNMLDPRSAQEQRSRDLDAAYEAKKAADAAYEKTKAEFNRHAWIPPDLYERSRGLDDAQAAGTIEERMRDTAEANDAFALSPMLAARIAHECIAERTKPLVRTLGGVRESLRRLTHHSKTTAEQAYEIETIVDSIVRALKAEEEARRA